MNYTKNIRKLFKGLLRCKHSKTINQGSELTRIISKKTLFGDSCVDNTVIKLPEIKKPQRKRSLIKMRVKQRSGNSKENMKYIRNVTNFALTKVDCS